MSEDNNYNKNINPTKTFDDGIEMEWIPEKEAWFPKITEEFIHLRNLNYGFIDNTNEKLLECEKKIEEIAPRIQEEWEKRLSNDFLDECNKIQRESHILTQLEYENRWSKFYQENVNKYRKEEKKRQKNESKKRILTPSKTEDGGWFNLNEDKNTSIYVENLPLDIKIEEFIKEMSKVGMIMNDFYTHKPKAKLYKMKNDNTKNKGDGLVCYLKTESIDLAMDILDGSIIRGNTIKVSRAKFEPKEDFVPNKIRKMTNVEKNKMRKHQQKLFTWTPDCKLRPKKDNTVIMKNMFDYEVMKNNPELIFDIKEKLKKDLVKIGEVKSVKIHELNPEGVVQVDFADANESDIAVEFFNNKLWNGREITASLWDGKTKYKIKETTEQEIERLKNWNSALGSDNQPIDDITNNLTKTDEGEETGDEDCESD